MNKRTLGMRFPAGSWPGARRILAGLVLAAAVLPASAQFQMTRSVFGNGGAPGASTGYSMNGTLGQTAIGFASGPAWSHDIGFWSASALPTPVDDQPGTPSVFRLDQNQPNPFNPKTTIRYALPTAAIARLRLYDIGGRLVRSLLEERQSPGYYEYVLDATGISSGVYFYRLDAGSFSETRKLVLLK